MKDDFTKKTSIINISDFKQKNDIKKELAKNRKPLYKTHLNNSNLNEQEFNDKLLRIRTSLEKINKLMIELKKANDIEKDIIT